jgi:histidinol phosphatase-like PHP family hydrolase
MNIPKYDFHIHTKYLKCADETMDVKDIIKKCESLGITKLAITDHLNNFESAKKHLLIAEDLKRIETDVDVYFGVELNYMGSGREFVYNEELKEDIGFQFAIGGIHNTYVDEYDIKKIIDIQHKYHIKTCENSLVSALVHPYWFWKEPFKKNGWPMENPLKSIPKSYIRELAQASKATNTAIELNACSCLLYTAFGEDFPQYYEEYAATLASEGAIFALGSDAHSIGELEKIEACFYLVEKLGLDERQIWKPDFLPFNMG